jgi:predicted metalloprotease
MVVAAFVAASLVGTWGGPAVADTSSRASSTSTGDYHGALAGAIDDIQAYWADTLRDVAGVSYRRIPDKQIIAYNGHGTVRCGRERVDPTENAFYCYPDNTVVYDDAKLLPRVAKQFGAFTVAVFLAHEWGHVIQGQLGIDMQSVYQELQADCFAGAWVGHLGRRGHIRGLTLKAGDLDAALGGYLTIRDEPGASAQESGAHGSAFDRVSALQDGYDNGASYCVRYVDDPPVVVLQPFTSAEEAASGGNLPIDQVLAATVLQLNTFYSLVEPRYSSYTVDDIVAYDSSARKRNLPTCGGTRVPRAAAKSRVFYCIDDDYFGFDDPFLTSVYDNIGDFGVSALIGSAWAEAVQFQQGLRQETDMSLLQSDCYNGGWTAAFYLGRLDPSISISPGDLDEVVQALIAYHAARGVTAKSGDVTFQRFRAFRQGFVDGYRSCAPSTPGQFG